MKKFFIGILFLFQHFLVIGQSQENFQLVIEEDTISGMPGLQSFVHAQVDGKWLQTFMWWIRNKNKCGQDH